MAIVGVVAAAIGVCVMLVVTVRRIGSKPTVLPADDGGHESTKRQWIADVAYDAVFRKRRIQRMASEEQTYSAEEAGMLARCMALFDASDSGSQAAKPVKHASTIEWASTKRDVATGTLVGRSQAVIRGAKPEDLVAYSMEADSRHSRCSVDQRVAVQSEILEIVSDHHIVVSNETRSTGIKNPTRFTSIVWKKVSDEPLGYIAGLAPIDHHDQDEPVKAHAVRAGDLVCFRFTALCPNTTLLEFACRFDPQGLLYKMVFENVAISQHVNRPLGMQTYFAQLRPTGVCTVDDGILVATMLMDRLAMVKKVGIPTVVSEFVTRTAMLRDCPFAHIGTMLLALALRMLGAMEDVLVADPTALSVDHARSIGRGFGAMVLSNASPAYALDEFLLTYPAMRTMDAECPWFRPMMEVVASRLRERTPLGLKIRAGVGAAVSVGDIVSDLLMIKSFLSAGQATAAYATIAMVSLTMLLQILLVVVQNKHRGWAAVAYEVGIVLCLLKAPVDAYRVASGNKQVHGAPLTPINELAMCKVAEMVSEAIPQLVLQGTILMAVADPSVVAVVSLVFSCLAIAYTSTTMAYDLETDPTRRRNNPEFYG
jgi:hypothetical protein